MKGEGLETVKVREQLRSLIESYRIEDLMTTQYEAVDPEMTISDVVARMRALDLHEIPVVEDRNKLAGVVSYGSLLKRKNLPTGTKAKSVIESPPEVTEESKITEVAESIVSTGYREIPVVRGRKILGIISREDIVGIIPDIRNLRSIPVKEVMTKEVQTVTSKDSLKRAIELMGKLDVRTLPVVDSEDRLVGIVGVKDIVNYGWASRKGETVGEITGRSNPVDIDIGSLSIDNPVTVGPETLIGEAARTMVDRKISTLPVVENDTLKGILSTYDLVELVASFKSRDVVYVQITGLEEEDRHSLEVMDKEIETELKKIARLSKPMLFTLHVTKHNHAGNVAKYSLHGRLITEDKIFVAKAIEWNLIKATVETMERIQKMVKEMKESRLEHRRRSKS
ncbi:MAG: CBS domain-containing protein [Methanomassiliicoccales archaeon]|nr:CBS domain-containing protein [Methanomassiliicoccales archaeon]